MKKIRLHGKYGRGKFTLVDDEDYESLSNNRWWVNQYGHVFTKFYAGREVVTGKQLCRMTYLHRYLLQAPEEFIVDHKNGDPLDNQKANLRLCVHRENLRNSKLYVTNKSGFKGVARTKSHRWQASIRVNQRGIHLGTFDTPLQAAEAYNVAALKHFGEFARLNKLGD